MIIIPDSASVPQDVQDKIVELIQDGYLSVIDARVLYLTPAGKTLLTPPQAPLQQQLNEFENLYAAIQSALIP